MIDWFEGRGKAKLLRDDLEATWVSDFLDFIKRERIFATFLTPSEYGGGDPNKRWDTSRNAALSEIFGFYGLAYWYAEQVTILGLGPIWQSDNIKAKERAAEQLEAGGVMAFGLSEREHGADIYNTDMLLTPAGDDDDEGVVFRASGEKYYIGNGNVAGMVSVFSRRTDVEGADGYVWFVADSGHANYELIGNVVHGQMYVSNFRLNDYPVHEEDILCTGPEAFSAALNTVNVGKFNLCSGSIGMCEHAFYEAITHANNRILYGNPVTDFPHVRASFVEAYAGLVAMKLFSDRAIDYFRSASLDDRRYLLFNPVTKSKVTSEGETVVTLLWDVLGRQGLREEHLLLRGGAADRRVAAAGGHRARQRRADPEVHAQLHVQPERRTRRSAPATTRPTTCSSGRRVRPAAHPRCSSPTGQPVYEKHLEDTECGAVLRAGAGAQRAAGHRRAGRRPNARPRLPARRRAPVHAGRLWPADPRAGRSDRAGLPTCVDQIFDVQIRDFSQLCRRVAWQAEFDSSATRLGDGGGTQAGRRCGPLRSGLAAGQGLRWRLRDAAVAHARREDLDHRPDRASRQPHCPGFGGR